MKLGLIVFANDSGLGNQTRDLANFLKPDRLLAIDSSPFSKNKIQHFDWYSSFSGYRIVGFPTNFAIKKFLSGLTHVFICENPINHTLFTVAKRMGIKVYLQTNYEFCDHLQNHSIDLPYKFLMPSYWMIEDMIKRFGRDRVVHLPPPIFSDDFREAREYNLSKTGKINLLHIVGTLAVNDRNGTLDLLKAIKLVKRNDFDLTIKSQHQLPEEYMVNDPRIKYSIENSTRENLYRGYDALILPRRYGGLSMTCNEALMSAMPVIMTDISPNDELLPKKWLVQARFKGKFKTREMTDIYESVITKLAKKIEWILDNKKLNDLKLEALEIGHNNFSSSVLKEKYNKILYENT